MLNITSAWTTIVQWQLLEIGLLASQQIFPMLFVVRQELQQYHWVWQKVCFHTLIGDNQ